MQSGQQAHIPEEAWQHTPPSHIERFRKEGSPFEAEAPKLAQTFCGQCGFWVDGHHQCPPVPTTIARIDDAQHAPRRLTAFCQTRPEPDEVAQALQALGFHLAFSMPAEASGEYMGLPPLPAQFHYEDEIGTSVEYLAGEDTLCLADEDATFSVPLLYPPHCSRFWLTPGGQDLAMKRVQETMAKRWALNWLDQRNVASIEEAA